MNFLQVFIQNSDIVIGIVLIGVLAFIIGGGIATLVTYLMARKTQSKAKSYYRNVFLIAGAMSVIPICIILLYFLSL